jgi:HAMP domain-containing protein
LADKTDDTIAKEVDRRLDYLFGESDESPDFDEDSGDFEDSPLKELKPVVLSIDWEINDEIMTKFMGQLNILKDTYKDDKILLMFLQILGSAGKHIKAKKASADPDVIRLLNSVYASLEKVILSKGMTEAERKKTLRVQVNKFKKVREQIALRKAAMDKEKEVSHPEKILPLVEEQAKDMVVQEEGWSPSSEVEEEAGQTDEVEPVIEEQAGDVVAQEEGWSPASEVEEEERPVISSVPTAPVGKPRGLGIGKKIGLLFLVPLIIVVAVSPLYIDQLAGLSSQITEMLQTHVGVSVEKARTIAFVILGGTIILICLIASLYGRRLSGRIKHLTDVVDRFSAGELDAIIEKRTGDEIGKLAEAIGRLRDNISISSEE